MNFLEYMYYESLPYFYAGMSVFAFINHETSKILPVAGLTLAFCSYHIFQERYKYRTYKRNRKIQRI